IDDLGDASVPIAQAARQDALDFFEIHADGSGQIQRGRRCLRNRDRAVHVGPARRSIPPPQVSEVSIQSEIYRCAKAESISPKGRSLHRRTMNHERHERKQSNATRQSNPARRRACCLCLSFVFFVSFVVYPLRQSAALKVPDRPPLFSSNRTRSM